METINAVCHCKDLSEDTQVIAIREKPLEKWGFWAWSINILLLLITLGGWFPFLLGWIIGSYFLSPTYSCQFCGNEIDKIYYR